MARLTDKHCGKHDISELYIWNHEIGPNQIYTKKMYHRIVFYANTKRNKKNFFSMCEQMNIVEKWYKGTALMKL